MFLWIGSARVSSLVHLSAVLLVPGYLFDISEGTAREKNVKQPDSYGLCTFFVKKNHQIKGSKEPTEWGKGGSKEVNKVQNKP